MKNAWLLILLLLPGKAAPQLAQQLPWYQRSAIYQIYPLSFQDSNSDGWGDIPGIISRLDHIQKLGFETIWISPVYPSPLADFGYDIQDYCAISPLMGSLADADSLIQAVHRRGMKIVFDLVMNHTSVEHEWFKSSVENPNGPKSDWYVWRDGKGKNKGKDKRNPESKGRYQAPPNNWKAAVGGSGWQYHPVRNQWYRASFLPFQPDLNYHNPQVKAAMFDVARFWLKRGVDGFRLDIFNMLLDDGQGRNNPPSLRAIPNEKNPNGFFQQAKYTVNLPDNFLVAKELRKVLDEFENPDRFLIGEVFGNHETLRKYLGERQDGLHLIFLFDMLDFRFRAGFFRKKILEYEASYPAPYMPVIVFGNHDRKRSISRIGNDPRKAKLLSLFQFSTRGVPVSYMGEEIGMHQAKIPLKQARDPLAKKFDRLPEWLADLSGESLNRDECRTPMQWDSTAGAGFCLPDVKPWLPIEGGFPKVNVSAQEEDSISLLNFYRQMLHFRAGHPGLNSGSVRVLPSGLRNVLLYSRQTPGDSLAVVLNFRKKPISIHLDMEYPEVLFSTDRSGKYPIWDAEKKRLRLEPFGGAILGPKPPFIYFQF